MAQSMIFISMDFKSVISPNFEKWSLIIFCFFDSTFVFPVSHSLSFPTESGRKEKQDQSVFSYYYKL